MEKLRDESVMRGTAMTRKPRRALLTAAFAGAAIAGAKTLGDGRRAEALFSNMKLDQDNAAARTTGVVSSGIDGAVFHVLNGLIGSTETKRRGISARLGSDSGTDTFQAAVAGSASINGAAGIYGEGRASNTTGVHGEAIINTNGMYIGVHGKASFSGIGVKAEHTAPTGLALQVVGKATFSNGATVTGVVTADSFSGSGATLTNLSASNVNTGVLAIGRLPSTVALTNAVQSTFTGTITAAHIAGAGADLTDLDAAHVSAGVLAAARLPAVVPLTDAVQNTFGGTVKAAHFSGDGADLTGLDAVNIGAGTLAAARLPAAVPLTTDASTDFAGTMKASLFTGSGAGLASLNASNIATGIVADGRLSANVALHNKANTFTGALTAPGVLASSFGGIGGAPQFANAGVATIPVGKTAIRVSTPLATSGTGVLVTLQSDAGAGVVVKHVVVLAGKFNVVLSAKAKKPAKLLWLVVKTP